MMKENMYDITITKHLMGTDIAFQITGGKAHIGAVATAYIINEQVTVHHIELPHHKEGALAKECAVIATNALGCTSTVAIGIHIDQATKEQITDIENIVRTLMKREIDEIKS